MSAATRRPYLSEDVHFVTRFRGKPLCRSARVTMIIGEAIELYIFARPVPFWEEDPAHDENEHKVGTWHYSCIPGHH